MTDSPGQFVTRTLLRGAAVSQTSRSNVRAPFVFEFSSAFPFSRCCDWLAAQSRSGADAKTLRPPRANALSKVARLRFRP